MTPVRSPSCGCRKLRKVDSFQGQLVTPEMLRAGRRVFLRERKRLDDLWNFYDCDLDEFLRRIFLGMSGRQPPESAAIHS